LRDVAQAARTASTCPRRGSLRYRDGSPSILHIRHISLAAQFINPVSSQSIRTSANMSRSNRRDSGARKNTCLRTLRGMPNSRQKALGGGGGCGPDTSLGARRQHAHNLPALVRPATEPSTGGFILNATWNRDHKRPPVLSIDYRQQRGLSATTVTIDARPISANTGGPDGGVRHVR
jgi:hypothetical protein